VAVPVAIVEELVAALVETVVELELARR